jgi:hypothetical protein
MVKRIAVICLLGGLAASCMRDHQKDLYLKAIAETDSIRIFHRSGDSMLLYKTIRDSEYLLSFKEIFSAGLHPETPSSFREDEQWLVFGHGKQSLKLSRCNEPASPFIKVTGNGTAISFRMTYRMGMFPDGP